MAAYAGHDGWIAKAFAPFIALFTSMLARRRSVLTRAATQAPKGPRPASS
jgi:hypothetical protein